MAFDDKLVEELLKQTDIVKVVQSFLPLVKKGKNYLAKCPFHDDSDPSLTISPDKQIFKCFVCGTGGSAITFVQKYLNIPFMEAVKKVAEISGFHDERLERVGLVKHVDPKKAPLLKCLADLTLYYEYALSTDEGKEGLDYLESRHLTAELRSKYKIGYAFKNGKATCDFLINKGNSTKTIEDVGIAVLSNGNYTDKNAGRVIFPICDADGAVIGYSARRIADTDEAKYINSPETYLFHKSNVLYNYHIAKEKAKIAGCVYVTEGFMDVLALSKIGMDNAVAIMGTALTNEHIQMLRKLNVEIRLCLDGDLPGQSAMMKASKALQDAGLQFLVVDNQGSSKDPDEILNEDGPDTLKEYLNKLLSPIDFFLGYYTRSNPLKTVEQKRKLAIEFIPALIGVNSQLILDNYLRKLSAATGFDIESLRDLLKRVKNETKETNQNVELQTFHPERKILRKLELAERELLYQMMNNREALEFYDKQELAFYDSAYRSIANYMLEYAKNNSNFDAFGIITSLEASELEDKDAMLKELTTLYYEQTHPNTCSPELLDNLLASINSEKNRIFEEDTIKASFEGKNPLEQARILDEYNKRKLQEIDDEEEK